MKKLVLLPPCHPITFLDNLTENRKEMLNALRKNSKEQAKLAPYVHVHPLVLRKLNKFYAANGDFSSNYEWLSAYEQIATEIVNKKFLN